MPRRKPKPRRHLAHTVAFLVCLGALAVTGCSPKEPAREPAEPAREPAGESAISESRSIIDLGRRLREAGVPDEPTVDFLVWTIDEDQRVVLFQHPPKTLRFGPFTGRDCVLRFGLGLKPQVWATSDGVTFRVALAPASDLDAADAADAASLPIDTDTAQVLFEESIVPTEHPENQWFDREVDVPDLDGTTVLVLETNVGEAGDPSYDHAGWSSPHLECTTARETSRDARPSVVLVSIDTLRRDRLGLYGHTRPTSPTIDRIGDDSVVFDRAMAPAPYTLPSHASMLTGLEPVEHRAGFEHQEDPMAEVTTLAERLSAAGYRTVALSAGGLMSRRYGYDRGFDEWHQLHRANLRSTLPIALDALVHPAAAQAPAPVFAFIHTYDVHGPYQQPEPWRVFRQASEGRVEGEGGRESATWRRILGMSYHSYLHLERFATVDEVVDAYDSGIRFVDEQIAWLDDYLAANGLGDSILIITSDHGEMLFDRGRYIGHACTLEDPELRIPLLIRAPGQTPQRRSEPVSLIDIAPTVLNLVGIAGADELPGVDLLAMDDIDSRERTLRGISPHLGSNFLRGPSWQVVTPTQPEWHERATELFGSSAERFEHGWVGGRVVDGSYRPSPGALDAASDLEAVRTLVRDARALETPGLRAYEEVERDPEDEAALKALGYVQ